MRFSSHQQDGKVIDDIKNLGRAQRSAGRLIEGLLCKRKF
jgi:hypothetical protein